jgi:uncharacterized protein HemX
MNQIKSFYTLTNHKHKGDKMRTNYAIIAALIIGLACGTALAQDQQKPAKTPRITHRQVKQQARIEQGVKSGELTKGETQHLEKEQAKIQSDKEKAKADGKVTPKERRKIKREQNKASRDIKRLKHNDNTSK